VWLAFATDVFASPFAKKERIKVRDFFFED